MALYAAYKTTADTIYPAFQVRRFVNEDIAVEAGELFLEVTTTVDFNRIYYVVGGVLTLTPVRPNIYAVYNIGTNTWSTPSDATTYLPAPTATVVPGLNSAIIDITPSANPLVKNYMVFRSTTPTFTATVENLIYQGPSTDVFDEGLNPDVEYYYRFAISTRFDDNPANLNISPVYPLRYAPSPATGLVATAGVKQIALTWTATPALTDDYQVFRNTVNNSATATLLGTVESNSYIDSAVVSGTNYFYWIRVVSYFDDVSAFSTAVGPVATTAVASNDIGTDAVTRSKIITGAVTDLILTSSVGPHQAQNTATNHIFFTYTHGPIAAGELWRRAFICELRNAFTNDTTAMQIRLETRRKPWGLPWSPWETVSQWNAPYVSQFGVDVWVPFSGSGSITERLENIEYRAICSLRPAGFIPTKEWAKEIYFIVAEVTR